MDDDSVHTEIIASDFYIANIFSVDGFLHAATCGGSEGEAFDAYVIIQFKYDAFVQYIEIYNNTFFSSEGNAGNELDRKRLTVFLRIGNAFFRDSH